MIRLAALAIAPILGILPNCDAPTNTGEVIWIAEYTGAFDANPGDTVNVVLSPNSPEDECNDMGGDYQERNSIPVCIDIDF
jgi:hypothetical protein